MCFVFNSYLLQILLFQYQSKTPNTSRHNLTATEKSNFSLLHTNKHHFKLFPQNTFLPILLDIKT